MPIPMAIARFNRRFTNKVLGPIVSRLPGFAFVRHTGRRSGKQYRTPVAVFSRPGGWVIALTYGPDTQWVRNVMAADGAELEIRGEIYPVTSPRLFHDPKRRAVPIWVRPPLRLFRAADFLEVKAMPR